MKQSFKKYSGGMALMFSVLLLLIGVTQYDSIFTSAKYDVIKSADYIKTAISSGTQPRVEKPEKINLSTDGDILVITETADGPVTQHYRAISTPELIGNYEALPKLQLEIIDGDQLEFIDVDLYKIDREKGLVFFFLKLEKGHQTVLTNIYTGDYIVTLIE